MIIQFLNRQSIRIRILLAILSLTIIAVMVTTYLGINSTSIAGLNAQESSNTILRKQTEDFLVQLTLEKAKQNNQVLESVREDAGDAAQYAVNIFSHPDAFDNSNYWDIEQKMFFSDGGAYINSPDDTSTVWVPSGVNVDDMLKQKLEIASYMDMVFVPIYNNSANTVAIYIIGKEDFTRLYPNIDLPSILPSDYPATQDVFFQAGTPENDPDKQVMWTPIYDDPAGQGLLVTAVAPIYVNDEFQGIIGLDLSLGNLTQEIEAAKPIADGYLFLVDGNSKAIALPHQGYLDLLNHEADSDKSATDLSHDKVLPEFAPVIDAMKANETGFQVVQHGNEELFVAYTSVESTGWSLATVVRADKMLQATSTLQTELEQTTQGLIFQRILPAGVIIVLIAVIIGLLLTNRLVVPIQQLAEAARRIGEGKLDTPIPVSGADELGILGDAFRNTTAQLRTLIGNLEQRVAARTHDLEVAANVSNEITTILNLDELLPQVANQTLEGYGLYHVSVFLFDNSDETLNLTAGVGRNGLVSIHEAVKFQLADNGLVPKSARDRAAIIENDVSKSSTYAQNSQLPDTQSELCIPMLVGQRLVGVLDLQSEQKGRFDEGDVRVLTTLATQIAIAVQNAQSYTEAAEAREIAEKANDVKSLFLASMSHELRTPLNSVINFTKFVVKGVMGPVTERQEETLNKVIASGQHLLALINDVLDMSKIESGSLNLFVEDDLNPNEILDSVISSSESLLSEKPVELQHDIQADLPIMRGDRKRITQILLNVVSNACKFTEEGSVKITAHMEEDKKLLVSVQDTGPGIAEEDKESVFSSFKQTHTGLRQGEGTGLGMPISKSLAEAHGGRLWFESELGKGTTFYIELPIQYEKLKVSA